MTWSICMYLSYGILILLALLSIWSFFGKHKINKLSNIALAGVFIASMIMLYPCYEPMYHGVEPAILDPLLACAHHAIRLFIVDGEMSFVTACVFEMAPPEVVSPYLMLASILFLAAPGFTFGFILSFFKSISAYNQYLLRYRSDKYFFSEVNENTLALAEDIRRNHPKALIAFADTDEKDLETHYNYVERLKSIRATCFNKDIASINVTLGSKNSKIFAFLFSLDEKANHKQASILRDKFSGKSNLTLYVHSVITDSELMPANEISDPKLKEQPKVKIRGVNDVRLLINNILYNKGHLIFDRAAGSGEERVISALVIGMGNHGTEMLKALPSFCQMDGYKAYMTAMDIGARTSSVFSAQCPELMDDEHNGDFETVGESHYKISFFDGMDVTTSEFVAALESMPVITYVFISLGNDSLNISTAKKVRAVCSKKGADPVIQAVVYDSDNTDILENNKTGERFGIDFIGDIKTFYTEEVIMASEVERAALQRHLKWGKENEFWDSEYNYKSSVASAIHRKMKEHCRIDQIDRKLVDRDERAKENIRILEHMRWNAYMRSEGYTLGPKKDKIAKTHYDLVPFYQLSPEAQAKDDD